MEFKIGNTVKIMSGANCEIKEPYNKMPAVIVQIDNNLCKIKWEENRFAWVDSVYLLRENLKTLSNEKLTKGIYLMTKDIENLNKLVKIVTEQNTLLNKQIDLMDEKIEILNDMIMDIYKRL